MTREAAPFPYLEDLTITFDNALEREEVLNESDESSAINFGDSASLGVDMTLTFRDELAYTDFRDNNAVAWGFLWTLDATNSLDISLPRLNIESWSAPIRGAGRMTVAVRAMAEYSAVDGYEARITLRNQTAAY